MSSRGPLFAVSLSAALLVPAIAHADPVGESSTPTRAQQSLVGPNELSLDGGGSVSRIADRQGTVGVRYARPMGSWALAVEPHAGLGAQDTANTSTLVTSLGVDATVERRIPAGPVVFIVGAGGALDYVWQRLQRTRGAPGTATFEAFSPGPVASFRARIPLWPNSWVDVGVRGSLGFTDLDGSMSGLWTVGASTSWGVSF